MALGLFNLGKVVRYEGAKDEARILIEQGLSAFRTLGDTFQVWEALGDLATLARERGDHTQAKQHARECLELIGEHGTRWYLPESLGALASVALANGRPDRATRLLGAAEAVRASSGAVLPAGERAAHEADLAAARAALGAAPFEAALAAGRGMTAAAASAYALEAE